MYVLGTIISSWFSMFPTHFFTHYSERWLSLHLCNVFFHTFSVQFWLITDLKNCTSMKLGFGSSKAGTTKFSSPWARFQGVWRTSTIIFTTFPHWQYSNHRLLAILWYCCWFNTWKKKIGEKHLKLISIDFFSLANMGNLIAILSNFLSELDCGPKMTWMTVRKNCSSDH